MKIPAFKRIIIEDYPTQYRDIVSKLAFSINSFMDTMTIALNTNLTISDNLAAVQTSINVTVDSFGTPTIGRTVKSNLASQCGGISVINALNNTSSVIYPTNTPFITFTNGNGTIIISNITGLKPNNSYTLTVILWPRS